MLKYVLLLPKHFIDTSPKSNINLIYHVSGDCNIYFVHKNKFFALSTVCWHVLYKKNS